MSSSHLRYGGTWLANLLPPLPRRTNVVLLALLLVAVVPGAAAAAPFGNALRLDGIDDYASIADNVTLDLGVAEGEDFTIEAFVFVPNGSNDTNDVIFYKQGAYALSILFASASFDAVTFRFWSSAVSSSALSSTTNLSVGWHHVAAVFDNEWSAIYDRAAIFLDGNELTSYALFELTPGVNNSPNLLSVGANSGAVPFDGWLEEARFSNTVRYTGPYTVPSSAFSPDGSTSALWHFNEAAGSTSFADSSGFGNTLTGQNGAQTGSLTMMNWAANNSADFDADLVTDFGLYRGLSPADSLWYAPGTAGGDPFQIYFGATSDIPVPGDYDGDGRTDAVIYRPSSGLWYGPRTGAAEIVIQLFLGGVAGDIPIPGDYNGDGRTDPAFFRPSTGLFFATNAAGNQVLLNTSFGAPGDVPVPRDYDGDGKTDPAIYRENATPQGYTLWYAPLSGGGVHQIYFGAPGDIPVPGDYNGDMKADSVIWRPSTGLWYGPQTGAAAIVIQMILGQNGDVPIPGYYDANLAVDPAIVRPSTGLWFSVLSGGGTRSIAGLGLPSDVPVQKRPALAGGV